MRTLYPRNARSRRLEEDMGRVVCRLVVCRSQFAAITAPSCITCNSVHLALPKRREFRAVHGFGAGGNWQDDEGTGFLSSGGRLTARSPVVHKGRSGDGGSGPIPASASHHAIRRKKAGSRSLRRFGESPRNDTPSCGPPIVSCVAPLRAIASPSCRGLSRNA